MKNRISRKVKTYSIDRTSDRIKMYKRTAGRIWRDRRVKTVLVMGTAIVMLAPIAVSALIGAVLDRILRLVDVDSELASLISEPSLLIFESLIVLLFVAPLFYGMRAYAARAVDGDAPTAETIVGFYSNPTYRGYSRRGALLLTLRLSAFSVASTLVSRIVLHLGDKLERYGDVARAAILYFGTLIALGALAVMLVGSLFEGYLDIKLFLDSPGRSRAGLRSDARSIMTERPETRREAVLLNLSFIGWYAVVMLTAGIAALYVVPYVMLSNAVCRSYLCRRGADRSP